MAKKKVTAKEIEDIRPEARFDILIWMKSGNVIPVENLKTVEWTVENGTTRLKIDPGDYGVNEAQIIMPSLSLNQVEAITYMVRAPEQQGIPATDIFKVE